MNESIAAGNGRQSRVRHEEGLKYAVVRRWKDNPRDFQVLEYLATKKECQTYIRDHPDHATDCQLEIAKWE